MQRAIASMAVLLVLLAVLSAAGAVRGVGATGGQGAEAGVGTNRPSLIRFEQELLPQWLAQHAIGPLGQYRFAVSEKEPHFYGITDVVHLLHFVNQLQNWTAEQRAHVADQIQGFQNSTGFYRLAGLETTSCGYQPWHASAYGASALALLDTRPRYNNTLYAALARNSSTWAPTFDALYNVDPGLGCGSIHDCAHKIVAIPAVLTAESGLTVYGDFLTWWNNWLFAKLDPVTGALCPAAQKALHGEGVCLGSGAAAHFMLNFENRYPWPYPNATRSFALSQQLASGLWSPPTSWLNVDGVFLATRSNSSYLDQDAAHWPAVRKACTTFVAAAAALLNNATLVLGELSLISTHSLPGWFRQPLVSPL
ncbi:uncharacterized protein MONBRDRAFT_25402 [Monosiga brevicollis MX1]|uniref:Phospholipase B-like n=1 Tax=Monosiga brevicollis TaxID=81824 RepID=A9UZB3_MONBE|nr:uncharacterized protein MONBRDRAFT_25402 [Monosiga brevicollis MX1]EDQ89338.1 predicted protein [Monosiga brevicollis MX1]|eukprot:XP_001745914.1 hypothetical protein [Monosiga brevicollis MX1]